MNEEFLVQTDNLRNIEMNQPKWADVLKMVDSAAHIRQFGGLPSYLPCKVQLHFPQTVNGLYTAMQAVIRLPEGMDEAQERRDMQIGIMGHTGDVIDLRYPIPWELGDYFKIDVVNTDIPVYTGTGRLIDETT